jgi:anti-sigma B factor antagonist
LTVVGELDLVAAPALEKRLNEVIGGGTRRILLDLSAVTFLDSTTLTVLIGATRRLRSRSGALVIVCDNPNIVTIFEITALNDFFDLFKTTSAAVALLQDLPDVEHDGATSA